MPNTNSYKTLIIMPYLPLSSGLKIDNILIWSFKNKQNNMIHDVALRNQVSSLLTCYKTNGGRIIDNPAVVSIRQPTFANPTQNSINKLEMVKNILLFANVWENNQWSFVTSDNFETYYQRFVMGSDAISTSGGWIHRIMTGGYNVGEVTFVKPDHINIPFDRRRLNSALVSALTDCIINQTRDVEKARIVQALNPFFNTYRNSNELSYQTRMLNLIMAFELLFGQSSRSHFRNNIRRLSHTNTHPQTFHYPIINTTNGEVLEVADLTMNEIWGEEVYKLRHKIIHGNSVENHDFSFNDLLGIVARHEPHFYIAVNFFMVCVINRLREIGFINVPKVYIHAGENRVSAKNISGIDSEFFQIGIFV